MDDPGVFASILEALEQIGDGLPLIFPIHPRTRQRLGMSDAQCSMSNLRIIEPLAYLDFLALQRHAMLVITDSGGIQEETTFLGVPCLTVRKSTERPVTVTLGTNILVGQDVVQLRAEVDRILAGNAKKGEVPPLWDGHSAERIADAVVDWEGRRDRSSPAEPATGDCSS